MSGVCCGGRIGRSRWLCLPSDRDFPMGTRHGPLIAPCPLCPDGVLLGLSLLTSRPVSLVFLDRSRSLLWPQMSKQSLLILAVSMGVTTVMYASIIWLIEQPTSSFVSDELMAQTGRGDMQVPICSNRMCSR